MRAIERPILFSGEMVRANLREVDPKTQTRRVAKFGDNVRVIDGVAKGFLPGVPDGWVIPSPYGKPGDRLWVRETFNIGWLDEGKVLYRADGGSAKDAGYSKEPTWKPSIFMPRGASRLTLEIVKVRVERVQDISEADCLAEGVQIPVEKVCNNPKPLLRISGPYPPIRYFGDKLRTKTDTAADWMRAHYASLWDSINDKRGYGWDKNPWVWVVEYKRLEAN